MNPLLLQILAADTKQGGLTGLILPALLLGPLMYMMIVPQRKQRKKAAEMLASLKVGDDVVTSGGIHGTVNFLDDAGVAHVEVDTDVVIRVSKSALTRVSHAVVDVSDGDAADGAVAEATEDESDGESGGAIVSASSKSKK